MSTATPTLSERVSRTDVSSALVAAVLGSIAFGIVMSLTLTGVLFTAIPGMYGLDGVSRTSAVFVGWAVHIGNGTLLGLAFGGLVTTVPRLGGRLSYGVLAGVGYGIVLWLVLASFVMPVWVGVTTSLAPPVPDWQPWSLVGHILYGVFLGALIPVFRRYE